MESLLVIDARVTEEARKCCGLPVAGSAGIVVCNGAFLRTGWAFLPLARPALLAAGQPLLLGSTPVLVLADPCGREYS